MNLLWLVLNDICCYSSSDYQWIRTKVIFWSIAEMIRTVVVDLSVCLVFFRAEQYMINTNTDGRNKNIWKYKLLKDALHCVYIIKHSLDDWLVTLTTDLLLTRGQRLLNFCWHTIPIWSCIMNLNLYVQHFIWRWREWTQPQMTLTEILMKPLLHPSRALMHRIKHCSHCTAQSSLLLHKP